MAPGYEAPEIASELRKTGRYQPKPAHDVWAFGLLLLQLLGGKRPKVHTEAIRKVASMIKANLFTHQSPEYTLDYASSLCSRGSDYYLTKVSPRPIALCYASAANVAKQLGLMASA